MRFCKAVAAYLRWEFPLAHKLCAQAEGGQGDVYVITQIAIIVFLKACFPSKITNFV
jgi:hypothetical protein